VKRMNQEILSLRGMAYSAMFGAITAIGAYIVIPLPLVPITLQTFFVSLAAALLGGTLGALSQVVYVLIGVLGCFCRGEGRFRGAHGSNRRISGRVHRGRLHHRQIDRNEAEPGIRLDGVRHDDRAHCSVCPRGWATDVRGEAVPRQGIDHRRDPDTAGGGDQNPGRRVCRSEVEG
jgi:hypothetical protein